MYDSSSHEPMDRRDRRRREFVQSEPSSIDRNGAYRRHVGQGRCNRKTSVSPKPPSKYRYEMGDRVRIATYGHVFRKWSQEILEICEKYPTYPMTYGLKDLVGEPIKGKFYEQEIQKVVKTNDVHKIEKVLKTRKRGGKIEYLVKWKGYPDKVNGWMTDVFRS
jgi:hypothetical protein